MEFHIVNGWSASADCYMNVYEIPEIGGPEDFE